jgi:hypothetical protein
MFQRGKVEVVEQPLVQFDLHLAAAGPCASFPCRRSRLGNRLRLRGRQATSTCIGAWVAERRLHRAARRRAWSPGAVAAGRAAGCASGFLKRENMAFPQVSGLWQLLPGCLVQIKERFGKLRDFLAQRVLPAHFLTSGRPWSLACVTCNPTSGSCSSSADVEAFSHALHPAFGRQVGEFRRAVQHIAQLFMRQLFGLQRAHHPQHVLGRAQIKLQQREVDMRGSARFRSRHDGFRHVDDDEIKVCAGHVDECGCRSSSGR